LKVYDSAPPTKHTQVSRTISVSAVCFSREMALPIQPSEGQRNRIADVSYAFVMAIGDQKGSVYVLDFVKNKYVILISDFGSSVALELPFPRCSSALLAEENCW
jgi:hypothetical protein